MRRDGAYRRQQIAQKARLPVIGLKKEDRAWFAMIRKGPVWQCLVQNSAEKGTSSYNHAYIRLHLREEDEDSFAVANRVEDVPMMNEKCMVSSFTLSATRFLLSGKKLTIRGWSRVS